MQNFIKIVDNIVIQKQRSAEEGFVEAHSSVGNSLIYTGGDPMDRGNFVYPELTAAPTMKDISRQRLEEDDLLVRMVEREARQRGIESSIVVNEIMGEG